MISDLKKIEFHDLPVKSLSVNFVEESITLIAKDYNEKEQDYFEVDLLFTGVSSFYFQKIDGVNLSEIYDCAIKEDKGLYFIEFTMLTERAAISCIVSFYFKKVRVDFRNDADW